MKRVVLPGAEFTSGKFASYAHRRRWKGVKVHLEAQEKRQRRQSIKKTDENVQITYTTDYVLDHLDYITLEGTGASKLEAELRDDPKVALLSEESVFEALVSPKDTEAFLLALRRLAVLAPALPTEPFLELFSRGLTHDDSAVRRATMLYVLYPNWPELRSTIVEMAKSDRDIGLREDAAAIVEVFDEDDPPTAAFARVQASAVKRPDLPGWLESLKQVSEGALPWRWIHREPGIPVQLRARVAEHAQFDDFTEELGAACRERLLRSWPLAIGAICRDRIGGGNYAEGRLWFDPEFPKLLWLDLGTVAPVFWVAVEPEVSALQEATRFYFSDTYPESASLDRSFRCYAGRPHSILYSIHTGERLTNNSWSDEEVVDQYSSQAMLNPALENLYWGSATPADPYPASMPPTSPIVLGPLVEKYSKQAPTGPVSVSFRTRWSKSVFTVESYFGNTVVVDVSYASAPHAMGYGALDSVIRQFLPDDLPADVAEATRGLFLVPEELARKSLDTEHDEEGLRLILAGICAKRKEFDSEVEAWSRDSRAWVRSAAIRVAPARGRIDILRDMTQREEDQELLGWINEVLAHQG